MTLASLLRSCTLLSWLLLSSHAAAGDPVPGVLQNRLAGHPSAYLAMHGQDPVHWQDWGQEVLARARAEDKLIFVSSGYFSCHWCHVMQRESYADGGIAAQINEGFIPVKLDRELHGALDAYLIEFLERTQGHAGWPLNVWLTPEGYPLIGATYLPRERFGLVLESLRKTWRLEREKTRNLARRTLLQVMLKPAATEVEALPPGVLQGRLVQQALELADPLEGGFGNQNRFPMAPQLLALLEVQARDPGPALGGFLETTLEQMANRGLRDHLAGGFFRYTVDPGWLVPHYEKMLYTQAQLALVYLRGADVLARPDFRIIARETLDFVERYMQGAQGGFIASFSAIDGAGEEGGVYLWSAEALTEVLGDEDANLARRFWNMSGVPAQEHGYLPTMGITLAELAESLAQSPADLATRLDDIRERLLAARARRQLPADPKELAGWNGLMLAAYAEAARVLGDEGYRVVAKRLHDFLLGRLWDGEQLVRARTAAGQVLGRASLADYAYVAAGLAAYARLAGPEADTAPLQAVMASAWRLHFGGRGWRLDASSLIPGPGAEAALADGALPSPSAVLMDLAMQGGPAAEDGDTERLANALALSRATVHAEPFWHAGQSMVLVRAGERPGLHRQP